ncbi:hypothetical protein B0H65DRAFT_323137 [Neurospora tetraspora]|uniref:Secreted protein n=1 Tax=Neurospora tetraspora TaxID=94610 RepID=A0AAE0MMZ5_9PEZI|nr:hypothetical protein B0H65DRAFT_323137 [Neurospora tetraspora]
MFLACSNLTFITLSTRLLSKPQCLPVEPCRGRDCVAVSRFPSWIRVKLQKQVYEMHQHEKQRLVLRWQLSCDPWLLCDFGRLVNPLPIVCS